MFKKGLKFGMLFQLAIGPMCVLIFNTAREHGFLKAFVLGLAVTLADAIYIILASVGTAAVLKNEKVQKIIKWIGVIVLILFGLNIGLSSLGLSFIPSFTVKPTTTNIFLQGLILTLSSPLTIIFWSSVFTTRLIEDKMSRKDLILFAIGCVSATLIFATFIALIGTVVSTFIPEIVSKSLNIFVGLVIIYFGIKLIFKKVEA